MTNFHNKVWYQIYLISKILGFIIFITLQKCRVQMVGISFYHLLDKMEAQSQWLLWINFQTMYIMDVCITEITDTSLHLGTSYRFDKDILLQLNVNASEDWPTGSIIPNVTLPDIGSFETDQQAFEYIFNHVIADMAFSVCSFFYKGAWIAFGLVYSNRKYGILYFSNFEGTKRRLICIDGEFSYHETW